MTRALLRASRPSRCRLVDEAGFHSQDATSEILSARRLAWKLWRISCFLKLSEIYVFLSNLGTVPHASQIFAYSCWLCRRQPLQCMRCHLQPWRTKEPVGTSIWHLLINFSNVAHSSSLDATPKSITSGAAHIAQADVEPREGLSSLRRGAPPLAPRGWLHGQTFFGRRGEMENEKEI